MSDQLRDKIARALHRHATDDGEVHILWGGVEEHEEEVAEWIPFADAVLAVLDLDKIRAEAVTQALDLAKKSREFWARVKIPHIDGCWLWTGSRRGEDDRYGGYAGTTAHRYSWALHNGHWPNRGQVVRHRCDTGLCVNPGHLKLGTQAENVQDMVERSRGWWQGRACRNGHPRTETNTYVNPHGKRECLDCRIAWYQKNNRYKAEPRECEHCGKSIQARNMARHVKSEHQSVPEGAER